MCNRCDVERKIDTTMKLRRHLCSGNHTGVDKKLILAFLRDSDFFQDNYDEGERSSLRSVKSRIQLLDEFISFAGKPISKVYFNSLLFSIKTSIYKVDSYYMLCPVCFHKKLGKTVPEYQLNRHRLLLEETDKRFSSELKRGHVSLVVMDFAADRRSKQT